ncbi:RHS repeat domain-containing protein [Paenibacillus yonginensis]|nr:RHS repeat-associated core domain-containing protein [Paenibacillus yonginensis]
MDADGNLLYQSDGEGKAAYEYDARNRLVKSGKARYTYNALGSRTSLTWRGKTTHYVVDEQGELSRVLMEVGEDGSPKAYYVYGLGLIGREDAEGSYVSYHSDIRGSTTLLTDEQGCVTDRYTYGLYGELEQHEGTSSQPFCYNGRDGVMTDPNGLYYMRARYYDPSLKRFLNRDVLRGDLTDGQTLNRYAYVNGDPVRYVDPLGLCKVEGTGETYRHLKDYENNKYFTRSIEYNAGKDGTGFTYKVYQRNDIDWNMVRTTGARKGRGLTNAEAAAKHGLAPILDDAGSVATLHHSQQKGIGPLFEASTRYHNISNAKRAPLHPYKGKLNPFYPMDEATREAFQKVDSINYWKRRGLNELGGN